MTTSQRTGSWSTLFAGFFGPPRPAVADQQARFLGRLRSSLEGAYFQAAFDVAWTANADGGYPRAVQEAHIFQYLSHVAEQVTVRCSVLEVELTRSQVAIELNSVRGLPNTDVSLTDVQVHLSPDPAGAEFAARHEQFRREIALTRAHHESQAAQLQLMRQHILADSSVARLWWLDGKPERLAQMVGQGDLFERVVDLLSGSRREAAGDERIAGLIGRFLEELGPEHRELLLRQLGRVFESYERHDLAAGLNGSRSPADRNTAIS